MKSFFYSTFLFLPLFWFYSIPKESPDVVWQMDDVVSSMTDKDSIKICVQTPKGNDLSGVKVFTQVYDTEYITGQDGCVMIYNPESAFDPNIILEKADEFNLGLDIMDVVMTFENILGIRNFDCYQRMATDLNNSGGVSTLDVVLMVRSIFLNNQQNVNPSWKFLSPDSFFENSNPKFVGRCELINLNNGGWAPEMTFTAIKMGDTDNTYFEAYEKTYTLLLNEQTKDGKDIVSVKTTSEIEIQAINLEFDIDTDNIEIKNITSSELSDFTFENNVVVTGKKIRVIYPGKQINSVGFSNYSKLLRLDEIFNFEIVKKSNSDISQSIKLSEGYNHAIKRPGVQEYPEGIHSLRKVNCSSSWDIEDTQQDTIYSGSCDGPNDVDIVRYAPKILGGDCDLITITYNINQLGVDANGCKIFRVDYVYSNNTKGDFKGPFVRFFRSGNRPASLCDGRLDTVAPQITCKENIVIALTQPIMTINFPFVFHDGLSDDCTPTNKIMLTYDGWKPQVEDKIVPNGIINLSIPHYFDASGGLMKHPTADSTILQQYQEGKLQLWEPTRRHSSRIVTCDMIDEVTKFGVINIQLTAWDEAFNSNSCLLKLRVEDKVSICERCSGVDTIRPIPNLVGIATALLNNKKVEVFAKDFNISSYDNCTAKDDLLFTFDNVMPSLARINEEHYYKLDGTDIVNATKAEYDEGSAYFWFPSFRSAARIYNCENTDEKVNLITTVWDEAYNYDSGTISLTIVDAVGDCDNEGNKVGFYTFEQSFEKDSTYLIPFYSKNFVNGLAFQIEFSLNNCITKDVKAVHPFISPTFGYNLFGGDGLRLVWNDKDIKGVTFSNFEPLFYLEAQAKENGVLSDLLMVENSFLTEFTNINLTVRNDLDLEVIQDTTNRLIVKDDILNRGESYIVPLNLNTSLSDVNAINYTLFFNPENIGNIAITSELLDGFDPQKHVNVTDKTVEIHWTAPDMKFIDFSTGVDVFELSFIAQKNSILSQSFEFKNEEFNVSSHSNSQYCQRLRTVWDDRLTSPTSDRDVVGKISIFPNPMTQMLNIANIIEPVSYHISNSIGTLLMHGECTHDLTLDLGHLSSGVYFIQLLDHKKNSVTKKLIKF